MGRRRQKTHSKSATRLIPFYVFDHPPISATLRLLAKQLKIMKIGSFRTFLSAFVAFAVLCPGMLATMAHAQQTKSFGTQLMESLGWTFLIPFLLMIVGGITLIIYNGIAVRKNAFVKQEVVEPIMQEVSRLNIDGARALCEQYKLPVTSVLQAGLDRIQDDELDTDSIEKGLEEASAIELSKPYVWINMLNTIGSIAPMIGLLGTVVGMIGAFNVLTESGMGGESSKQMAGNISSALWTTAAGLITAVPTLIAYFIYKTKFGTIAAEVNRVAGEMVFTLVRAARGGFDEEEGGGEEYYGEEQESGLPPPMPDVPSPPG